MEVGVVMDTIINYFKDNVFLFYLIILIILNILLKIYYPKLRGYMGEFWVKKRLEKLPKGKYITLNDIMIEDENGTHQIDHIVISNYGIFVIEMKNYYGLIRGREYDDKWCQYLGRKRSYFINPIHQNYGHIKALANLLSFDEDYFISIICFSNQAKVNVYCNNTIVTQVKFLNKGILKYNDIVFNFNIEEIANKILLNNIVDKKIRKQHIKNIHSKVKKDKKMVDNMICLKCGNKLIKKKGRYGTFIGCSNFPKCRYIVNNKG